jgi:hypothetical protein
MVSKGEKELGLLGLIKLERGGARPAGPSGRKERERGGGREERIFFLDFPTHTQMEFEFLFNFSKNHTAPK